MNDLANSQMATSILQEIVQRKAGEVSVARSRRSFSELESALGNSSPLRGFTAAMDARISQQKPAIIAEIKKASPSKGLIREDFHPADHAADYSSHGATCLSVLTDHHYFQGRDDYLVEVRQASQLPILRKDFLLDPYQIAESRVLGADCVLLIVAALEQSLLADLVAYAQSISIDVLVEVHNADELERALQLNTRLIGINNRDLHAFDTSLQTTLMLAGQVPDDKLIITESGIHSTADISLMIENGIYGFLIGEAFMRAEHPGEKLREMFADQL